MPQVPVNEAPAAPLPTPASWLVRVSGVFDDQVKDVLQSLGADSSKRLGSEYHWIQTQHPERLHSAGASLYVRWNLPVHHSWPCNPQKMEGFIEKAAQTLWKKFGPYQPQAILMGPLDSNPSNHYYKGMASNLRGRTLQLFPPLPVPSGEVESQDPAAPTLFCLVGKEGLYSGLQSPRACNGLYPGGTKYISQSSGSTISRAGAKVAEALHYLLMYRPVLAEGSHWLELGASPGGMTSELLTRGYHVTAVDRALMDRRLDREPRLHFVLDDVAQFRPKEGVTYDAMLCDMNGEATDSIQQVIRLSRNLKSGGLVIFTLKLPSAEEVGSVTAHCQTVIRMAAAAGLPLVAKTHLSYNRQEFTLFFERRGDTPV